MQDLELSGLWWTPDNPDVRHAGYLVTAVSERPKLSLVGSFVPVESMNERHNYPVVWGFTDKGRLVTLLYAGTTNLSFSAPGLLTQELTASVALIGAHFASPDDVVAASTYADFTFLTEWLGPGRYEETHEDRTITIAHTPPSYLLYPIADLEVGLTAGWTQRGDRVRTMSVNASSSLKIVGEAPLQAVIDSWISPFRVLLTIAVGEPSALVKVDFKSERAVEVNSAGMIEAIFPVSLPPSARRTPSIHDMLFSYGDVASVFRELLTGWYGIHEQLEPVFDLYMSTRHHGGPMEVQFLNLVRAIEVFGRVRDPSPSMPKDEHAAMVEAIVTGADPSYQEWLSRKLDFSNEPTLKERLSKLAEQVRPVLEPVVGDLTAFTSLVANTRHYLTHYDPTSRSKSAEGEELFRTIQRLEIFTSALLLTAAGLDAAVVNDLFQRNQDYIFLRRVKMGLE